MVIREGMRVTSVPRTLVDLIVANEVSPEHIKRAAWRAFGSHLTQVADLEEVAKRRHLSLSRLEVAARLCGNRGTNHPGLAARTAYGRESARVHPTV